MLQKFGPELIESFKTGDAVKDKGISYITARYVGKSRYSQEIKEDVFCNIGGFLNGFDLMRAAVKATQDGKTKFTDIGVLAASEAADGSLDVTFSDRPLERDVVKDAMIEGLRKGLVEEGDYACETDDLIWERAKQATLDIAAKSLGNISGIGLSALVVSESGIKEIEPSQKICDEEDDLSGILSEIDRLEETAFTLPVINCQSKISEQ